MIFFLQRWFSFQELLPRAARHATVLQPAPERKRKHDYADKVPWAPRPPKRFPWCVHACVPIFALPVSGKTSRAEKAAEEAELRGCFPRNRYHPKALVSPETSRLERALLACAPVPPSWYECFMCTSGMLCCVALVVAFQVCRAAARKSQRVRCCMLVAAAVLSPFFLYARHYVQDVDTNEQYV